jgi:hypothetical protein
MKARNYFPAVKYGAKWYPGDFVGAGSFDTYFGTDVWYVDGNDGLDTNGGGFDDPYKTIQKAINSAGAGDTIYINSLGFDTDASDPTQYAEDLDIPYAKHDLKLIGVNSSGSRLPYAGPKIKNAAAALGNPLLKVHAPGVHLENLQFNCTRNSGTYGIWFTGETGYAAEAGSVGFTMVNCMIKNGSGTYYGIRVQGGYGGMISNCTLVYCAGGIWLGDNSLPSSIHTVEWCDFKTINGTACTLHILIQSGSNHDWTISHCTFCAATTFINIGAVGSGIIDNCGFNDETTTTVAKSTGKIVIPAANDTVGITNCQGGGGENIVNDGG